MPEHERKSTLRERMAAKEILEIMQGLVAGGGVEEPKPDNPKLKLGWTVELIRNQLAKRRHHTTFEVVRHALDFLHKSGRVSKSIGVFGFKTYELISAKPD